MMGQSVLYNNSNDVSGTIAYDIDFPLNKTSVSRIFTIQPEQRDDPKNIGIISRSPSK